MRLVTDSASTWILVTKSVVSLNSQSRNDITKLMKPCESQCIVDSTSHLRSSVSSEDAIYFAVDATMSPIEKVGLSELT